MDSPFLKHVEANDSEDRNDRNDDDDEEKEMKEGKTERAAAARQVSSRELRRLDSCAVLVGVQPVCRGKWSIESARVLPRKSLA